MKDVADYVNDKKREADNLTAVLCIQDKLIGEFEVILLKLKKKLIIHSLLRIWQNLIEDT